MKYFVPLVAQDIGATADLSAEIAQGLFTTNNVWMMLSTALVFIMHLGFAGVETGFGQAKNTVNILFKNTITPILGIMTYAMVGFFLMYPGFETPGWFGFDLSGWKMFWFSPADADVTAGYADGHYTYWTDFLFQGMFAATAATIVSGAIAERVKISAYLIFTLFFVGLVYPLIGMLYGLVVGGFLHISTTIFFESSPHHTFHWNKLLVSFFAAGLAIASEYFM